MDLSEIWSPPSPQWSGLNTYDIPNFFNKMMAHFAFTRVQFVFFYVTKPGEKDGGLA